MKIVFRRSLVSRCPHLVVQDSDHSIHIRAVIQSAALLVPYVHRLEGLCPAIR